MKYPTLRLWDGFRHTNPLFRDDVRGLQVRLKKAGYAVDCDGYFGFETHEAVEAFQAAHGLVDDGIVGPLTWAAIFGRKPERRAYFDTRYAAVNGSLRAQLDAAAAYRPFLEDASVRTGIEIAVYFGIGSRESNWGLILAPEGPAGTGDFISRRRARPWRPDPLPPDGGGFGRGLMQIDFDAHEFARSGNWKDPKANIAYGADVLFQNLRYFERKGHAKALALRLAIAGYNCGPGNVAKAVDAGRDPDYYTHGRDYSADVTSRAGWFQRYGWSGER